MDIQIWEAQRISNKVNPNRLTPRFIKIKMAKDKEKILTATREKQLFTYKGIHKRLLADISAQILQVRRMTLYFQRDERKKKPTQFKILYSARPQFRFGGETKSFRDKPKLKESRTTKPALRACVCSVASDSL